MHGRAILFHFDHIPAVNTCQSVGYRQPRLGQFSQHHLLEVHCRIDIATDLEDLGMPICGHPHVEVLTWKPFQPAATAPPDLEDALGQFELFLGFTHLERAYHSSHRSGPQCQAYAITLQGSAPCSLFQ